MTSPSTGSTRPRGVLVASSLNLDVSIAVARAPSPGETVGDGSVTEGLGGKGANAAVAAARALSGTLPVRLAAACGADAAGNRLSKSLELLGVDTCLVQPLADSATGAAYIVVDAAGENRIIVAQGANGRFGELLRPPLLNALDEAAVVVLHLEVPTRAVCEIAREARRRGARVVLNPSPVAPADGMTPADWKAVDFCIVNETEVAQLAGVKDDDVAGARKLAERCADSGVVIVTRGADSVVVVDKGGGVSFIDTPPANAVVDTTSAGDTVTGYFAAGIAQGMQVREALQLAVAAASFTVETRGAAESIPTREKVEKRVNKAKSN